MEVVERGDRELVMAAAEKCLEQAGPDGYLLGGTASGTYTEQAARNFQAMVGVAEAYGRSR